MPSAPHRARTGDAWSAPPVPPAGPPPGAPPGDPPDAASDTSSSIGDAYVRIPRAWVALPVSPGAKALLLHLCAAANPSGDSWYSYAQLGEIVMRSRSAVAGYVDELRQAGIIVTMHQSTANGFNYRVRIRIVEWSRLLERWSARAAGRGRQTAAASRSAGGRAGNAGALPCPAPAAGKVVPMAERRVQRSERNDPSGQKKIHQTNTTPGRQAIPAGSRRPGPGAIAPVVWSDEDEAAWRRAKRRDGDGCLDFDEAPDEVLLHRATAAFEAMKARAGLFDEPAEASAAALEAISAFARSRALEASPEALGSAAAAIAAQARSRRAIEAAVGLLDKAWQPHWRRISTPHQVETLIREARKKDPAALGDSRELSRFASRAMMARRELRQREMSARAIAEARARRIAREVAGPSDPPAVPEAPARRFSAEMERMIESFLRGRC